MAIPTPHRAPSETYAFYDHHIEPQLPNPHHEDPHPPPSMDNHDGASERQPDPLTIIADDTQSSYAPSTVLYYEPSISDVGSPSQRIPSIPETSFDTKSIDVTRGFETSIPPPESFHPPSEQSFHPLFNYYDIPQVINNPPSCVYRPDPRFEVVKEPDPGKSATISLSDLASTLSDLVGLTSQGEESDVASGVSETFTTPSVDLSDPNQFFEDIHKTSSAINTSENDGPKSICTVDQTLSELDDLDMSDPGTSSRDTVSRLATPSSVYLSDPMLSPSEEDSTLMAEESTLGDIMLIPSGILSTGSEAGAACPRAPEEVRQEMLQHMQEWERGNIDYMGKDSFANIQAALDLFLK